MKRLFQGVIVLIAGKMRVGQGVCRRIFGGKGTRLFHVDENPRVDESRG